MASQKPFIDFRLVNKSLVEQCVKLYPRVLEDVYRETRSKSDQASILADDVWRYEELPSSARCVGKLSKEELARLVRWKITHGTHRPFLPGMIQKNVDADVENYSSKAASTVGGLSQSQDRKDIAAAIESALTAVCNLKGVGPATGTLVLSILQPSLIPFFEDELFYWSQPDHTAKLKYNKAEYKLLLNSALDVILSTGAEAYKLEQTAYVVIHADKLSASQKAVLQKGLDDVSEELEDEEQTLATEKHSNGEAVPAAQLSSTKTQATKGQGKHKTSDAEDTSLRRSKRRRIDK